MIWKWTGGQRGPASAFCPWRQILEKKGCLWHIFNGTASFRKNILEAVQVQSALRFLFSWSGCAILWTFCFSHRYSSNVRDFLVFVFFQSVVLSLAWLELNHGALLLRPWSCKSVPNEDLKLCHEQSQKVLPKEIVGKVRKGLGNSSGSPIWFYVRQLKVICSITLQVVLGFLPWLRWIIGHLKWDETLYRVSVPQREKHLQLWSLSIR